MNEELPIEEQPVEELPVESLDLTPLTDSEMLGLIAVTLDDIKMLFVTLITFYIIFKIVRWSN